MLRKGVLKKCVPVDLVSRIFVSDFDERFSADLTGPDSQLSVRRFTD